MLEQTTNKVEGFVKIIDKDTGEVLVDKNNSVHYENLSVAIAKALANRPDGTIQEMHFGNGGSVVSGTGAITYMPPNTVGPDADLYNKTWYKVINDRSPLNSDPLNNFLEVRHLVNSVYSDIIITCTLDYSEPGDQFAFDDATAADSKYVFDEMGLKVWNATPGAGDLITHVIFNPIQKSLNRRIEVQYTLRINMY